ncbi:hypothetical protein C8Q76DRAFT_799496 [Earliella scabrosa]|nr:hypothetical protein C8Q76DRAFT_799496 [Earliella scabrosa]
MSAPPALQLDTATLVAPQLFGHLFNYGLFGVLVVQVYNYHLSFSGDSKYLKSFVYGLFILECLQIVMASHDAYMVLGVGWGDITALLDVQWLWFDGPVLGSIISASVQGFYAWRIHLLSKSWILSGLICAVALMQCGAAMATGIIVHVNSVAGSDIQTLVQDSTIVWLAGTLACDVLIALCMLFYLSRGKRGLASDAMLSRLIRLTIETGTATATVACVDLALFVAFKHNNLHQTPALIMSKLYSNSIMMTFNNRTELRKLKGGIQTTSSPIWISASSQVETTVDPIPGNNGTMRQEYALKKFNVGAGDSDSDGRFQASDVRKVDYQVVRSAARLLHRSAPMRSIPVDREMLYTVNGWIVSAGRDVMHLQRLVDDSYHHRGMRDMMWPWMDVEARRACPAGSRFSYSSHTLSPHRSRQLPSRIRRSLQA